MISASSKLEESKSFIEHRLNKIGIDPVFDFVVDEETGGHCYFIHTPYAVGIFSDNNKENILKMYIVSNSAINYAINEDLTTDQFLDYHSCIEVPDIYCFSYILQTPLQHQQRP
jgi:hypothetical protein